MTEIMNQSEIDKLEKRPMSSWTFEEMHRYSVQSSQPCPECGKTEGFKCCGESERIFLSCVETCTDEEFGDYFESEELAMSAAKQHPHACQFRRVSEEEFQESMKCAE